MQQDSQRYAQERPLEQQDLEAPRISAHEGGKAVGPMHQTPLPFRRYPFVLISCTGWVKPLGHSAAKKFKSMKNPNDPSEIKPATFQLVVQVHGLY
jgi:hypothetical protein